MKYVILLLALFTASITLAEEYKLPQIQVTGVARQTMAPDELRWNLHIKNRDQQIAEVAKKHIQHVSKVLSYLRKMKIPEEKIQTSQMQLQENWVYHGKERAREGFFASTSIRFTLKDFSKYISIWKSLSELKNVEINSVNFECSTINAIQQKLKIEALRNAKTQAAKLASTLGSSLGEPLFIGTEQPGNIPPFRERSVMMMAKNSTDEIVISPGEQTVTSTIFTIFRLVSP